MKSMLELINNTPWQTELFPGYDLKGNSQLTCVIKIGFSFDASGQLFALEKSEPILEHDYYYEDDPINCSICGAEESMPFKQGGELLIYGSAQPYQGQCQMTEVAVTLNKENKKLIQKRLKIFGNRDWQASLLGVIASKPDLLKALPLRYEYAYGGSDPKNPAKVYPYNPIGIGYSEKNWRVAGLALPQIEQGPKFITSPDQQPLPAGFGPVDRSWQPRLNSELVASEAGKNNISPEYYNTAPLDQRISESFQGGEELIFSGLLTNIPVTKEVKLIIPKWPVKVQHIHGSFINDIDFNIDTLILDTDKQTLHLVGRSAIPWDESMNTQGYVKVAQLKN